MMHHTEYRDQLKRRIKSLRGTVKCGNSSQRRKAEEQIACLEYELLVLHTEKDRTYAYYG